MTVSFVGSASAEATSLTLPAHQAGDLIVVCAASLSGTVITTPTGWHMVREQPSSTGGTRRAQLAFKIATSSAETSGTWTNAAFVACVVYRHSTNVLSLGGNNFTTNTTTTVTYPVLSSRTTINTATKLWAASSWVIGAVFVTSNAEAAETAPSGMVNRTSAAGASAGEIAIHDTDSAVASWASTNVTLANSVGSSVYTIEILDTGIAKTSAGMLVHPGMSGGMRG